MTLKVGIDYHADPADGRPDPGHAGSRAEELELDSFWTADNLTRENKQILEAMLVLAMAGATTQRIEIGIGVMQLALRATAWAAKEVATMQVLTGNRFVFGVGVGGTFPDEWAAAGKSTSDRGRRTDAMLATLPGLLAGRPTELPDASGGPVTLLPAVPMPPIWIGGGTPPARRRVARAGDGWLPAVLTPDELRVLGEEIKELAAEAGRPAPEIGIQLHGDLRAARGDARHRELSAWMRTRFRKTEAEAEEIVLVGSPEEVAERLAAYREAGATLAVVSPLGGGWEVQAERLSEARRLL